MRSSGRASIFAVACAVGALVVGPTAQSAEVLYRDLLAQERVLRADLDFASTRRGQVVDADATARLRVVRAAVSAYEDMARQFPQSGYSDNALWQAAVLSADAFWQFGDARDRAVALRLFSRLQAEFPTSSLIAGIASHRSRLEAARVRPPEIPTATLTAIRREVLPDALRFTLELEREATFAEERLDGPSRLLLDLRSTGTVEALAGATLTFADDVVRQAKVASQPDHRTRIVFDLQGAARHSVYPLYNPYRVVIDFERAATDPPTAPAAPKAAGALPTPAPAANAAPAPVAPPRATAPPVAAPPAATANRSGGFSLSRQLGLGVARVVIDPGHGGRDPGAQARGLNEAEVVLDIALELERLLAREPDVEVLLTRRTNVSVALEERTAIANKAGADLFLSIHVNASADQTARGAETYFLNFASNPAAEALAARENAGSARTMSSLPDIVKAIALNNKIDESKDFASAVQRALYAGLRKTDRETRNLGVKQAPFMVLIGATMPSVLVEVSFLTNRAEGTRLRTTDHRHRLAQALFDGVMAYQRSLKRTPALRSSF